jgi:hypothetical protein
MASRVITALPSEEWAALLTGFTRSAFRLEALQHYTAPDEQEAFARFCAGQDAEINLSWWTELARSHTTAGRTMSRVRIIIEPPSDYTRFELVAYPTMAAAGDDIRIIAVSPGAWPAGIPHEDFWLFDDRDVWVMRYAADGTFLRAELLDDRRAILDHLRWRDAALAQAIPVADYLAIADRRAS